MIQKNERRRYASDLRDRQRAIIKPLPPPSGKQEQMGKAGADRRGAISRG